MKPRYHHLSDADLRAQELTTRRAADQAQRDATKLQAHGGVAAKGDQAAQARGRAVNKLKILRALAADCRDQGDHDIAEGIEGIIAGVVELCAAIKTERKAADSGDVIEHFSARIHTTLLLTLFHEAG